MLDSLDKLRSPFRIMLSVILPCCDIVAINSCLWFRYKWHLKKKWSAFSISPHLQCNVFLHNVMLIFFFFLFSSAVLHLLTLYHVTAVGSKYLNSLCCVAVYNLPIFNKSLLTYLQSGNSSLPRHRNRIRAEEQTLARYDVTLASTLSLPYGR